MFVHTLYFHQCVVLHAFSHSLLIFFRNAPDTAVSIMGHYSKSKYHYVGKILGRHHANLDRKLHCRSQQRFKLPQHLGERYPCMQLGGERKCESKVSYPQLNTECPKPCLEPLDQEASAFT